ncbi:MAG: HAD-IA family hydrolase [Gemmataceae bacterium]
MTPQLLTFDVFGTLIDWREGLRRDLDCHGIALDQGRWESLLADQERVERLQFASYTDITTWSLIRRLGLPRAAATHIAENLGRWPLFPDTQAALKRLMERVPCVAMTNSDRSHGRQAQDQLGFPLTAWLCAEETRVYKPAPAFWTAVSDRLHVPFSKRWWHVSAYADYDLATAASLGLTTVLVRRPHCRPGQADKEVSDLQELLTITS